MLHKLQFEDAVWGATVWWPFSVPHNANLLVVVILHYENYQHYQMNKVFEINTACLLPHSGETVIFVVLFDPFWKYVTFYYNNNFDNFELLLL